MDGGALAIQVAGGVAGLRHPIGLVVGDEEGIDLDDRIDLVAVLVVGGVFEADSLDAAVVVIPWSAHAYALDVAEFGVFRMAGNLVALDDDYSLERRLLGFVAGVDRRAFFLDRGASHDHQGHDDKKRAFHVAIS
jgi:hypothetical protein